MELEGEFRCPGKECQTKLCLVHNSKNGGRTCFLKAIDDEKHNPKCEYKIENYKEASVKVSKNGIFTERQINDAVRRIVKDYTQPIEKGETKKKQKSKTSVKKL